MNADPVRLYRSVDKRAWVLESFGTVDFLETVEPHRWCRVIDVTRFGDPEPRTLDYRCDECRAADRR